MRLLQLVRTSHHRTAFDTSANPPLQEHKYYVHHPTCLSVLATCGIHDAKKAPWGKLDTRKTSQSVGSQPVEIRCLHEGCKGRVKQTVLEKGKAAGSYKPVCDCGTVTHSALEHGCPVSKRLPSARADVAHTER